MVGFAPLSASHGTAVRMRAVIDDLVALGARPVAVAVGQPAEDSPAEPDAVGVPVVAVATSSKATLLPVLAWHLRALAPELDAVMLESAMFAPAVSIAHLRLPVIWDVCELEGLHYRRLPPTARNLAYRGAWWLLEQWAARRAEVTVPISTEEARWCGRLLPVTNGRLIVVGHRVPGRRRPDPVVGVSAGPVRQACLVFVGNVSAKHNAHAAGWILSELAPRLDPGARLLLVGPGTERLSRPDRTGADVQCLGEVADLGEVLGPDVIGLAPLASGAGVKTKVLDYLAYGCRVLATPVALEGIRDIPGTRSVELGDFPSTVADLLAHQENEEERERRVSSQYEWLDANASPATTRTGWSAVLGRLGWPGP